MNALNAIGGKAPKTFWGVLAVICFAINTDRDFIKWMPEATQEAIYQTARLGAVVGVYYFALAIDPNPKKKPVAKKKPKPKL